jgi:hypothetical protein
LILFIFLDRQQEEQCNEPAAMIKWLALLFCIWEFLDLNFSLEIENRENFLMAFLTSSSPLQLRFHKSFYISTLYNLSNWKCHEINEGYMKKVFLASHFV